MSADSHNPGCKRNMLVMVRASRNRCFPQPAYRNRWDCPGCVPYKLGKGTEHIVARHTELVIDWASSNKAVRVQAQRLNIGYMAMSMVGSSSRLIISEPAMFPEQSPRDAIAVMVEAVSHARDQGISRLAYNDKWRPSKSQDDPMVPIKLPDGISYAEVQGALRKLGIEDGWMRGMGIEDLRSQLYSLLEPRVSFTWTRKDLA